MNSIQLSLFSSRISAICEEMGAVLRRTSFSPNIRDRLDFSCAIFDAQGGLCAQAAHIPVHIGSMAYAMTAIVQREQWQCGDMLVLNDPFLGGTHLPDVTLICPCYCDDALIGFVANRAHHADIGAEQPGSMPLSSRLDEEGLVLKPQFLLRDDVIDEPLLASILSHMRQPDQARGDFEAQISANRIGLTRLKALIEPLGADHFRQAIAGINAYGERISRSVIESIPNGVYSFQDWMDDDGQGRERIVINLTLHVEDQRVVADFSGTADQVEGNINCSLAVTAAAVFYLFRCLMPDYTINCAGTFKPIELNVPEGCFLNASYPAAVAAGNVETSSRVVDVVMGALVAAIPERLAAASQGSMNNVAMGSVHGEAGWDYYETIGGGMGASPEQAGLSAIQTHMTNTLNTPIEVLESSYPLRILRYEIRRGSGGAGHHRGGDGMVREYQFQQPTQVALLTERRLNAPWGLSGGADGQAGCNQLNGEGLPPKVMFETQPGDRLTISTPGGGGWGVE